MSITPKAIQDLLDELEASRQARRRAWDVLQELRAVLTDIGNVTIRGSFAKNIRGRGSNPKTGFERLSSRSKSGSGATRGCRQAGRYSCFWINGRFRTGAPGAPQGPRPGGGVVTRLSHVQPVPQNDQRR